MTHTDGTGPPSGSFAADEGDSFDANSGGPVLQLPENWQWADNWDPVVNEATDPEGWEYSGMFGGEGEGGLINFAEFTPEAHLSDTVRRRTWRRKMYMPKPGHELAYL